MSYTVDEYDSRQQPPPAYTQYPANLPKLGQTRCYWALLSSDLHFIYLDPVLQSHLAEQADALVGKSLLAFVHPDEVASAKHDLGGVLETRTLHGSVTRVRFSRLSNVRRQLGYNGPPSPWPEADKVSSDKEYMAVDIVINWAAEGLVLCFIHATVDLTPNDNDESPKTQWTNWCGTPQMSAEQIDLLYHRLVVCLPPPPNMSRVFQILANQRDRPLLLSWPPDPSHGPSRRDFAKLVENVQINTGVAGGNDAKTSCTRRYKALQEMPPGFGGEVESIFIPHGDIIFACHKVNPILRSNTAAPSVPMQQLDYSSPQGYPHHQNPPYYEHGAGAPYSLPPINQHTQPYNNFVLQQPVSHSSYSSPRWAQDASPTQSSQQWPSDNGPPTAAYLDATQQPFSNRPVSPPYSYSTLPAGNSGSGETSPSADVVPPPRRRISPTASRDHTGPIRTNSNRPTGIQKCSSCKATSSPEWRKGPSGKKELCNACGLRYARSRAKKEGPNQTQQRRRKDKTLVAKRESMEPSPGFNARRSYGETSFSSAGSGSGSEVYPHAVQLQHHQHQQQQHHQQHRGLGNITPSPSPPASSMNFVHYAPGTGDSRASYAGGINSSSNNNHFYPSSVPSPLSSQHVLHGHQQTVPSHQHMSNTQLPPLGQLSGYAGRLSPLLPPPASMGHGVGGGGGGGGIGLGGGGGGGLGGGGGASHLHAPYDRDPRDGMPSQRERESFREQLPPTPLSAEPRISNRRSILTQQ